MGHMIAFVTVNISLEVVRKSKNSTKFEQVQFIEH